MRIGGAVITELITKCAKAKRPPTKALQTLLKKVQEGRFYDSKGWVAGNEPYIVGRGLDVEEALKQTFDDFGFEDIEKDNRVIATTFGSLDIPVWSKEGLSFIEVKAKVAGTDTLKINYLLQTLAYIGLNAFKIAYIFVDDSEKGMWHLYEIEPDFNDEFFLQARVHGLYSYLKGEEHQSIEQIVDWANHIYLMAYELLDEQPAQSGFYPEPYIRAKHSLLKQRMMKYKPSEIEEEDVECLIISNNEAIGFGDKAEYKCRILDAGGLAPEVF